jgi:hypothetical protein
MSKGKHVWQTEVSNPGASDGTMSDGIYWAEHVYRFIEENSVNAWLYWSFASISNGMGLITGDGFSMGLVNPRFYTLGNFSKFVRPGFFRIETTPSRQADALVSSFKDPATGKFAIVAINKNSSPVSMTFNLDFAASSVMPYRTSAGTNLVTQTPIAVANGSFTTSLPGQSVTTFVGSYDANTVYGPQITPSAGYLLPNMQVTITCGTVGAQIYYTNDGTDPTQSSAQYSAPFTLTSACTVKAKAFKSGLTASPVTTVVYQALRTPENPVGAASGLFYSYYEGAWTTVPNYSTLTPTKTGTVTNFDLSVANRADNFGIRFSGFINVPKDTIYTFSLQSDDGSKLYIGSTLVVNNDGLHDATIEQSGVIGLKAGKHALHVDYLEATGEQSIVVKLQGVAIAASDLFRDGGSSVRMHGYQPLRGGASTMHLYNIQGRRAASLSQTHGEHPQRGVFIAVAAHGENYQKAQQRVIRH